MRKSCYRRSYTQNVLRRQQPSAQGPASLRLALLALRVQRRIQRGIVVHLELPVDLEAPLPADHLLPQPVQAAGQVRALQDRPRDDRASEAQSDQLERRPTEVLRVAVKGMLPKNKLARRQLTKLKIYAGPEHPHAAQNPRPLDLESL